MVQSAGEYNFTFLAVATSGTSDYDITTMTVLAVISTKESLKNTTVLAVIFTVSLNLICLSAGFRAYQSECEVLLWVSGTRATQSDVEGPCRPVAGLQSGPGFRV